MSEETTSTPDERPADPPITSSDVKVLAASSLHCDRCGDTQESPQALNPHGAMLICSNCLRHIKGWLPLVEK